jgi:hypothetical protein
MGIDDLAIEVSLRELHEPQDVIDPVDVRIVGRQLCECCAQVARPAPDIQYRGTRTLQVHFHHPQYVRNKMQRFFTLMCSLSASMA